MLKHRLPALALTLALAACGGGGGGSSPAPATGGATSAPAAATQSVQVNMHIPGATTTASTKRSPQFVASSTQGVLVTVYASSDATHSTPLGSSATNVAPGSTACGGAQGARTCTISIPAPAGTDDFVFVTYDQPPSSGTTFPANAHLLGTGTVKNQTITVATANVVNVTLGGAIAALTSSPPVYSFAAGTGAHSYTYEINAYDTDGNVIIGAYVDQNGNADPITVTEGEVGGSGYTKIAVGAATPSTTATIDSSTDVVTVSYNGSSPSGYYVNLNGQAASGQTVPGTFNPLYVSSSSPAFTPGSSATIVLATASQLVTIDMVEPNATTSNVNATSCTNIATVTQPTQGSSSQSFTVTGGAGGTCTIAIQFAQASYTIAVTAPNNTSANVAVPGDTLAYFSQGSNGIAITTAAAQIATVPTATAADLLGLDDAGNIYVAVENGSNPDKLVEYTPSTSTYPPTYTLSANTFTPTDGADLWGIQASGAGEFAAFSSNFSLSTPKTTVDEWDPGHTGAPSRSIVMQDPLGSSYFFGYMAHDGSLYLSQRVPCSSNAALTCIEYQVYPPGSTTASRTITETIVPQASQANFWPSYINVGADGTLYVGEWAYYSLPDPLAGLYIYPPTGPERVAYVGAEAPQGIDTDNVGNIYVVNDNTADINNVITADTAKNIAVLSPDGQTVLRRITTDVIDANTLSAAADGTVFFSDTPEPTLNLPGASYAVPAGSANPTMLTNISAGNFLLWNGTRQTDAHHRTAQSGTVGTAHGGIMHLRRR